MPSRPVRVLLVDDSPTAVAVLQQMLAASPDIEVVGSASNGRDALALIPALQPDVICTDFHMPGMNGLEFTQQVMALFPRPILVVSSAIGSGDTDRAFSLLEAGAVDLVPKPRPGSQDGGTGAEQLIKRVKIVAGVMVRGRQPGGGALPHSQGSRAPGRAQAPAASGGRQAQIVVVGASTGGPQALQAILSALPADFSLPIVCVQHISTGFLPGLLSWLQAHAHCKVGIARAGERPVVGNVYFPPENSHLTFDRQGRFISGSGSAVGGHRPSIDVLFASAAEAYGACAVGVLLTGMGHDGAEGMLKLRHVGAETIAQSESSCIVYGMPRAAVERGAATTVLPLGEIPGALILTAASGGGRNVERSGYGE